MRDRSGAETDRHVVHQFQKTVTQGGGPRASMEARGGTAGQAIGMHGMEKDVHGFLYLRALVDVADQSDAHVDVLTMLTQILGPQL